MNEGVRLESVSWIVAEKLLSKDPVVIIPLGASAKEHGPHLPLNNDALIAEWLAEEVRKQLPVIVAPLVNTSFYPAFVDYPGSISLRLETARDLLLDICKSLIKFGVSRFYVVNTGLSTEKPLSLVREELGNGIKFEFLRLNETLQELPADLLQQKYGSHADEHETSLMLYIAPEVVDMRLAVDDGCFTSSTKQGRWSESGVFGQPNLASVKKGEVIAEALVAHILARISRLARH